MLGVPPSRSQKPGVSAAFGHVPLLDEEDSVSSGDGGQLVGDHHDRPPAFQTGDRLRNRRLVLRVERSGGFVEKKDRRLLQQRAGQRDALTLAA